MATGNWTTFTDVAPSNVVNRGTNRTLTKPPSSGPNDFVFAVNTISSPGASGAWGDFYSGPTGGFVPVTGETIEVIGAMRRLSFGGTTGFSCFLIAFADSASIDSNGYILGLTDETESHISLKKCNAAYAPGLISAGLPDAAPDPLGNGVLMRSNDTVAIGTWVHLKLSAILQPNNDVLLQVFQNDLDVNPIGDPPVWTVIPGMEGPNALDSPGAITGFIDDDAQTSTGQPPIISGRGGKGVHFTQVSRIATFDGGVQVIRRS